MPNISLVSIVVYSISHLVFAYLQVKFHEYAIIGLSLPAIWIVNDKDIAFLAKAIGVPLCILLHFYGSSQPHLLALEWLAYIGLLSLTYIRNAPPKLKARPKLNAKHYAEGESPVTPPNSPYRKSQSVGFVLPSVDELDDFNTTANRGGQEVPLLDSPRVICSEEKIVKDKLKLQLAIEEARKEEQKRITQSSTLLLRKGSKAK